MLVCDSQLCVPLRKILTDGDVILLLTPVVLPFDPNPNSDKDPFEPLGRALSKHHNWVRHVPYTNQGGITSTHVGFIKRAKVVIFVISGPSCHGQSSQVELSKIASAVGENRPQIVIACCNVQELDFKELPTVLQLSGYSPSQLESAAERLFQDSPSSLMKMPSLQAPITTPMSWSVEAWDEGRDVPAVHELWCESMPKQFQLNRLALQFLLRRDGYAMHFVVRDPGTREILGFCATYTTYLNSQGEKLVGSLAAVIVRSSHRGRGIGTSLHDNSLRKLTKTRGVSRLQLGSTFPRLMYGLPIDLPVDGWFRRRGWRMDGTLPGTGQEACDWLLAFDQWPKSVFPPVGLTFRPCEIHEFDQVLDIVEQESTRSRNMGWYDHYVKLADSFSIRDIMLGLEGDKIIATALMYVRNSDSPSAEDLPWAKTISDDVGGVTCICITGMSQPTSLI